MSEFTEIPAPSPDWERYKNTAKRDVVFAQFAYKEVTDIPQSPSLDAPLTDSIKQNIDRIPAGFQLFFCSDAFGDTSEYQLRAAIFVNHHTREIIATTAGTRMGLSSKTIHDLRDDAYLAFEKEPPKMKSVKELNQIIVDSLGDELSQYKIHYTGHSLGAALSDMAAADMAIRCRKKGLTKEARTMPEISTMTFENPGARKIIEKMYEKEGLDPASYRQDADYKGINNGRNFINRMADHAGEMWEIVDKNAKPNMFAVFLDHISRKLSKFLSIIPHAVRMAAHGEVFGQVNSHKLKKIDDFLCRPVEDGRGDLRISSEIDQERSSRIEGSKFKYISEIITSCVKVIYNAKIWNALKSRQERSGEVGRRAYTMVSPDREIATASEVEMTTIVKSPAIRSTQASREDSTQVARDAAEIDPRRPIPTIEEALSSSAARAR